MNCSRWFISALWASWATAAVAAEPEAAPAAGEPEPLAPEAPAPESPPPGPQLPSLVTPPVAAYPPAALADGIEETVLLELDVDEEGGVVEARVIEPAEDPWGFGLAARDGLLSATFTPARNDSGDAVSCTIQYRYVFTAEAAPALSVEGALRVAGTRQPLGGQRVVASTPDGTTRVTTSAEDGTFAFVGLPPGPVTVDASAPGYDPERVGVTVVAGEVVTATLYLESTRPWEGAPADEVFVVEGERLASEISQRSLRADEIRMQPGSAGDVVRAIQSLPGMARPPFNAGQLLVRGTGPDDSAFYLGGLQIPLVFHFGGLATVINGDSLEKVLFLPGNYGVRYGRTLGGVVDLRLDTDLPDRSSGYAAVDLFQSALFVEQTVKDRTSVTVSGRRSYIDTILAPILAQQAGGATVQLPRYGDVQARLQHHTRRGHDLDLLLLHSLDATSIDEGGDGKRTSSLTLGFQKVWARWRAPLGGDWLSEQSLMVGPDNEALTAYGDETAYDRRLSAAVRSEFNPA